MKLVPAFFILDKTGNILVTPADVTSADERLSYSVTVGDHYDCGGYVRLNVIKNSQHGLNQTDLAFACRKCGFSVIVPRTVKTYGDLYRYLRQLVGWDDDDD